MVSQQLIDYIKQQLASSVSEEQIKQVLLANNWQLNDIEEALIAAKINPAEQKPIIFSDTKSKGKSWKIIGIFALTILVIVGTICLFVWYMKTQGTKTKPDNNFTEVVKENPEEIAKRLVLGSFLDNDEGFIDERSYCNSPCQETIQKNLGITFEEYLDWSNKISKMNRKMIINEFKIKTTQRVSNKAVVDYTLDISDLDKAGSPRGSGKYEKSLELTNVDGKWVTDESEGLDYAIPLIKNYQKLFADLEKCRQIQMVEFNIPTSGGTFSINDISHPLNGFSIRFPKLKESIKISVGCSEFPLTSVGTPYISLPVSIKADKEFIKLVDKKDISLAFYSVSVSKVESDPTYGGKLPLIKIPYNDELVSKGEVLAFIEAHSAEDYFASRGSGAELNSDSKIATSFFTNLYDETWVVSPSLGI